MKRALVVLAIFFAISFFSNQFLFAAPPSLNDAGSVLFLHTARFDSLGLASFNIPLILAMLFLFSLLLLFLTTEIADSATYSLLILYRIEKKALIKKITRNLLERILILLVSTFFMILLYYFVFGGNWGYPDFWLDCLRLFLYLCRYYSLIYFLLFIYELTVLSNQAHRFLVLMDGAYILILALDALFQTSILTYSGSISTELFLLFFTLIIGKGCGFIWSRKLLLRGEFG